MLIFSSGYLILKVCSISLNILKPLFNNYINNSKTADNFFFNLDNHVLHSAKPTLVSPISQFVIFVNYLNLSVVFTKSLT